MGTTLGLLQAEERRKEAEQARSDEADQRKVAEAERDEKEMARKQAVTEKERADREKTIAEAVKNFVTNDVLEGRSKAGYLYREKSDQDDDSGWRITVGDETEEYMNESKNISYVSLGAVLRQDDSFVNLLDAPEGSSFRRDSKGSFQLIN